MFTANIAWGMMSPLAKFVLAAGLISPLVMTDLRIIGAAVLFWIGSLFQPRERVAPRDLLRLAIAGLLGIVLNQGCFIFGVGLTSPADASVITTSMPLWAMILAAFILKEPITTRKTLGIAAGATGATLLIVSGSYSGVTGSNPMLGDLLVLAAQFSYATYLVVFKNFVSRYSLFTIMKWMFTFSSICILPLSLSAIGSTAWTAVSAAQWVAIAFVVVIATFAAYVLVLIGQKNLRPTVAGMYNYIQPIVAGILAVAWGMDSFTPTKCGAIALIFSGVYLVTTSKSRADIAKRPSANITNQEQSDTGSVVSS